MSLEKCTAREKEMLGYINWEKVPGHVAFIMDGNGRWAREKKMPRVEGHRQGVEALREIVSFSSDINLRAVTFYAFSTENWRRPSSEVDFLLNLPEVYLEKDLPELVENNIKITATGEMEGLPTGTRSAIEKALEKTSKNTGMILNLAVNYGGRAEILRAVRMMAEKAKQGELSPGEMDEKLFEGYLFTSHLEDPDLIIRTSGEQRISNFLLWQAAYSEFWFTSIYWPEFSRLHLIKAILEYQRRKRRFGGVHT